MTAAWLTAAALLLCLLTGWRRAWVVGLAASVGIVLGALAAGAWT